MKSTTRRFWVIFLLVTLVTLVALAPARAFAAAAYPPGGPYFLYERDKGTSAADSFDYGVKLTDNKYANTVLVYGGYRIENSTSGGHHLWEIYDSDGLVGTIETSNGGGYCDVTVVAGKELVIRSQDNNGNHVVYKYFLFVGEISEPVRLADSANDFWLMMHSAPKAPDPIYEYTIEKLVSASQPDSAGLSATGWEKEVTVIKGESAWYKLTINARLTNGTGTANEPGATGADSISVWLRDPILGINNQEVVFT